MLDLAKREPIRSAELRNAARGEQCVLNLPGICNYDPETVVLAHLHDETFGKAIKADDTSAIHLCSACHAALDEHRTGLPDETVFKMLLRGLQRTIRRLVLRGVLSVKQDPPKPKQVIKKRPKGKSRPIQNRSNWPKPGTRKLQSRNTLRRSGQ